MFVKTISISRAGAYTAYVETMRRGKPVPATIKVVAAAAGVSPATVSRVLNGSDTVNAKMQARVLAAAKELGYRPNGAARSLRTRATFVLGIIISDITNPFFTAMVRGIEDTAQQAGYSVMLANTDEDLAKEARYLEVAAAQQMAGVVLSPASSTQTRLDVLTERDIPVITVNRQLRGGGFDSVTINNKQASASATTHLIQRGCQRIAFLAGPPATTTAHERLAGYRDALKSAGRVPDPALVARGNYRIDGGYQATKELLRSRPDGLFVSNNLMTIGALAALREAGLRAPDDLAFVGFDDLSGVLAQGSEITAVQQPTYDIGRCAAERLLARIQGDHSTPRRHVLRAELVIRHSSDRSARRAGQP
jgi:LacI family transcriptional regulator